MNKHIYLDVEYSTREEVFEVNEEVVIDKWERLKNEKNETIGKVFYYIALTEEQKAADFEAKVRAKTEKIRKECFEVINRGKLWYDNLTSTQLAELKAWYQDVLDLPEKPLDYTPTKPSWL